MFVLSFEHVSTRRAATRVLEKKSKVMLEREKAILILSRCMYVWADLLFWVLQFPIPAPSALLVPWTFFEDYFFLKFSPNSADVAVAGPIVASTNSQKSIPRHSWCLAVGLPSQRIWQNLDVWTARPTRRPTHV